MAKGHLAKTIIIFAGFLSITIFAVLRVGGFANVWKVTSENGRQLAIDFRPSPALPYTFWSALIAAPCFGLYRSVCCQHVAQRYLSVKTTPQAIATALVGQILSIISHFWLILIGLVMFTFYADCDPFTLGVVQKLDQMLLHFIMDLFQNIPGLFGILVSAICSAAVSSVSSGINALSLICHKEVLHIIGKDLTPKRKMNVTKTFTVIAGILTLLVTFLMPYLGGILDMIMTWQGIFLGPILGAYVLGMFFRKVHISGCLIGIIVSFIASLTLKLGNILYPKAVSVLPPRSIDECSATIGTITTEYTNLMSLVEETPHGYSFSIWQINSVYYGAISTFLTIIVGLLTSIFTTSSDFTIDGRLLWHTCPDVAANDEPDVNDDNDYHLENKYQPVETIYVQDCPTQSNV